MHREDGPAIIDKEKAEWYLLGKRHRSDGAAVIYLNSCYEKWYFNGLLHRKDGPAVILEDKKEWYFVGELHRENGPAVIRSNGKTEYWVNGEIQR